MKLHISCKVMSAVSGKEVSTSTRDIKVYPFPFSLISFTITYTGGGWWEVFPNVNFFSEDYKKHRAMFLGAIIVVSRMIDYHR